MPKIYIGKKGGRYIINNGQKKYISSFGTPPLTLYQKVNSIAVDPTIRSTEGKIYIIWDILEEAGINIDDYQAAIKFRETLSSMNNEINQVLADPKNEWEPALLQVLYEFVMISGNFI